MVLDFSLIQTERLAGYHNLSKFDCGDDDINDFIKNEGIRYQEKKLTTTTIFIYNEDIIGFFSSAADSLKLKPPEKEEHKLGDKPLVEYPAIKLARLGRDNKYRGQSVGLNILKWAIGYILECSKLMAVRFVTVDSYINRVNWYKSLGFKINEDKRYTKKTQHVSMRYDLFNGIPK